MQNGPYSARKMRKDEFKSPADMLKRDDAGRPCLFVCEHESGAKMVGLSWNAACTLADERNACELEAA